MLRFDDIRTIDEGHLMATYARYPALMVQGAGCALWDNRGNEYLDFLAGIGVNQLGHCHPAVVAAITRQAQQLIHTSNLLLTSPQAFLARHLVRISGMDRVFFAVCGATANETALKIARKHGNRKRPKGDYEIVVLNNSFHGRTLGALSATMKAKYQAPFGPLLPGFRAIDPNDIEALRAAVGEQTAAIHIEPILGESGVLPLTEAFVREARALADQYDALLSFDEVQTGMGRTGEFFAYQGLDIVPDLVAVAKGLGGGVPIGACLARGRAAEILERGDHGSTFGGNALACAAGIAVIETIERDGVLENCRAMGARFADGLRALGVFTEVRGRGLMVGARLAEAKARQVVADCFERRLIVNATDDHTLRFLPPLIVSAEQVDRALGVLADVLGASRPVTTAAPTAKPAVRHFLKIDDLTNDEVLELIDRASYLKQRRNVAPAAITPVEGRTVSLLFEKPSLRTRVSFEAAIRELGGASTYLTKGDVGMGTRESVKDIASNLSRWSCAIVARLFWQRQIEELAANSTVPVINALTEIEHPCQALADMMTVKENFGDEKIVIAYVGDANNVARSLARLATRLGYPFHLIGPQNFWLEPAEGLFQTSDLAEGLKGAKVVYTDVWISMGDEHEQEHRLKVFESYQVNPRVMAMADPDAIFLHCLPARRGYEVVDDVIDGPQSRVVDQAENRLHVQKALLEKLLGL